MPDSLFGAIPVEYGGLYADRQLIDIQELGISLQGLAKVSNGIVHFYLHGQIAKDSRLYQVRLFAGPPRSGSIIYEILALIVTGQLPLYTRLLCDMADSLVPRLFRAVIDLTVGRKAQMESMIEKVIDLASSHQEFAKQVHEGHMRDKAWLQDHITQLAQLYRTPMRELVQPVGKSCRQIKVGNEQLTDPAIVDEPEAEVLGSKEALQVEDMRKYRAVFDGVDTTNGTCKVRLEGNEKVLRGKITDPALSIVQNVYTHSLDTKSAVLIDAKPVTKDGEIVRLFISDGHAITDVSTL